MRVYQFRHVGNEGEIINHFQKTSTIIFNHYRELKIFEKQRGGR